MKLAISARVTSRLGSYVVADVPLVTPAAASALMSAFERRIIVVGEGVDIRGGEVLYQAGVIAEAVGADPQPYFARALETNPYFHPIHGPHLRALIDPA